MNGMTEDELTQMAKRFMQAKADYSAAQDAANDAKAAMKKSEKSRAAWIGELSTDALGQTSGPGLHVKNVLTAARAEAVFNKAGASYNEAVQERDQKKAEVLKAWESLVSALS
jgi:hypothetical protein